ncbi:MAG: DUF4399 domain-containing protein [Pseudomonadota bacterium]|nr:DUF4399 domain-containing protein [Pseudomonadota bacterium]
MRRIAAAFLLLTMSAIAADLPRSPAPADVALYFITPEDGAKVANPVTLRFGLKGMGVAPAGIAIAGTGHHHLLIDATVPPSDRPIPADDRHIHFGKGQTETVLTLTPGRHRLQLLLGDHLHLPHDPPVISAPITITVE